MSVTKKKSVLAFPTEKEISALIAPHILARGREYVEDGRVLQICPEDGRYHAVVLGSQEDEWEVELWKDDATGWDGSCTCPYAAGPCKHIAAALLTLASDSRTGVLKDAQVAVAGHRPVSDEELGSKVREMPREDLERVLVEQANRDTSLRQRLVLKVKQMTGLPVDLSAYRTQMRDALAWRGDFIPYPAVYEYVQGIARVAQSLRDLAVEGHPAEAAQLLEEFIDRCIPKIAKLDDSDGGFGEVVTELYTAWGEVLAKVPDRDPKALARKVLKRLEGNEYGFEDDLLNDMSAALGPDGLKIVEAEIEHRYQKIRREAAKENAPENFKSAGSPGWRLNTLLCDLADIRGDIDRFISLKEEIGLSLNDYLEIAERLKTAHELPRALAWVDLGLAKTSARDFQQISLRELKISLLDGVGHRSEARRLAWEEYRRFPSAMTLNRALTLVPEKSRWRLRQKAIDDLVRKANLSALIDICIPAKDVAPVAEVIRSREHPFDQLDYTRLQPAALVLEKAHPEEAARIYIHLAEEILMSKRAKIYGYAIEYYGRIKVLWGRADKKTEWERLAETVRQKHRLKSAFLPDFERVCAGE